VVVVSFGFAYTTITNNHVSMDTIISRVPGLTRKILSIINTILNLGIWLLIAWYSGIFALEETGIKESTIIMEWPIYPSDIYSCSHSNYVFSIGLRRC